LASPQQIRRKPTLPPADTPMIASRLVLVIAMLIWSSADISGVTDPFGGETVAVPAGPLVEQWQAVSEQISHDDAMLESCLMGGSQQCAPALALLAIVSEARQQHGLALIGHVNRAVNLAIAPAPGNWLGPLDALTLGNGDCKAYGIAKYFALRELGVPHVRIVIVRNARRHEDHMLVSIYFNGNWLILDDGTMVMTTDRDVPQYTPLFILDSHGVRGYRGSVS
jgi:predicted transglutaminase-like cysteine proteinase